MCKVTAWCKWLYSLPFLSSKLPWFINKNKEFKNAFYSHLATRLTDISTLNFMIIVTRRVSNAKIYLLPHPVRDGRCARETRLVTEYILILSKFSSLGCGASGVVFVCLCVCLCITWLLYAFFLLFCWRGSDKTYDFVCGIVNRRIDSVYIHKDYIIFKENKIAEKQNDEEFNLFPLEHLLFICII